MSSRFTVIWRIRSSWMVIYRPGIPVYGSSTVPGDVGCALVFSIVSVSAEGGGDVGV